MNEFQGRLLNASGCWCDTREKLIELANIPFLSGIVSKTCTKMPKEGNPEPNYFFSKKDDLHFNCKGLPNFGYEYYKDCFSLVSEKEKQFILSVAYLEGYSWILKDYDEYLKSLDKSGIVELNISCPNLDSRIAGYHKKDIVFILEEIRALHLTHVKIGLKLPPFFELEKIRKIANVFTLHADIVEYIVCCNTIPNTYYEGKYCGVSGKINKYIALGNIKEFKEYLGVSLCKIQIVGSGGIRDDQDIRDYLNAGADMVQLGSGFYNETTNRLHFEKVNLTNNGESNY